MRFYSFLLEGLYDQSPAMIIRDLRLKHDKTTIIDKIRHEISLTSNPQKKRNLEKALELIGVHSNEKLHQYIVTNNVSENDAKLISKWAEKGIQELKSKGIQIPEKIYICTKNDNKLKYDTTNISLNHNGDAIASILLTPTGKSALVLRADSKLFANIGEFTKHANNKGYFSTGNPYHVLYHEIGHYVLNSKHKFKYDDLVELSDSDVPPTMRRIIQDEVSIRAKENLNELYAEMFAGIMTGKKYSQKLMGLFHAIEKPFDEDDDDSNY